MPRLIEMVNAIKEELGIDKSLDMMATIDSAVQISGVKVPAAAGSVYERTKFLPIGSIYERTKFLYHSLGLAPVWSPTAAQLQHAAKALEASRQKKAAKAAEKAAAAQSTQRRAPDSPYYDSQEFDELLDAAAEQVEKQLSGDELLNAAAEQVEKQRSGRKRKIGS